MPMEKIKSAAADLPKNEGTFKDTENWRSEYQRNNKGGGLKNLRCFPYCRDKHVVKGFCGRSVKFEVRREKGYKRPLYAWAEFLPKHVGPSIEKGTSLKNTKCKSGERSAKCLQNPFYLGHVENEQSRRKQVVLFQFNKQKMGWNYSWHSNKHTSNVEHCIRVYLFTSISDDPNEMICTESFCSPSFKLYSRRKGDQAVKAVPYGCIDCQGNRFCAKKSCNSHGLTHFNAPVPTAIQLCALNKSVANAHMNYPQMSHTVLHSRKRDINTTDIYSNVKKPKLVHGSFQAVNPYFLQKGQQLPHMEFNVNVLPFRDAAYNTIIHSGALQPGMPAPTTIQYAPVQYTTAGYNVLPANTIPSSMSHTLSPASQYTLPHVAFNRI